MQELPGPKGGSWTPANNVCSLLSHFGAVRCRQISEKFAGPPSPNPGSLPESSAAKETFLVIPYPCQNVDPYVQHRFYVPETWTIFPTQASARCNTVNEFPNMPNVQMKCVCIPSN